MPTPRPLGASGISVQPIGLGGMPLSLASRPPRAQALDVICAALDAGMDFIDTADVYCVDDDDIGHNEALIAEALTRWGGDASAITVATKGGLRRPRGAWTRDASPARLRSACEASLRALGVEQITLYQLHAPDPKVPFADSMGTLRDLRDEGKIAHIGLSNVSVDEIREAAAIVPIVSVQNRCNPHDLRAFSEGVVAECERQGLAFLPYSPVGGSRGKESVAGDTLLRQLAEARKVSPYEVALAWLLTTSPAMIPIPGASRVASATSSARAMALQLDARELSLFAEAFPTS